jgi:hypothetical protein
MVVNLVRHFACSFGGVAELVRPRPIQLTVSNSQRRVSREVGQGLWAKGFGPRTFGQGFWPRLWKGFGLLGAIAVQWRCTCGPI